MATCVRFRYGSRGQKLSSTMIFSMIVFLRYQDLHRQPHLYFEKSDSMGPYGMYDMTEQAEKQTEDKACLIAHGQTYRNGAMVMLGQDDSS